MGGSETDEEENKVLALLQTLDELFGLEEKFKATKQYSMDHPIISLCIMVTIAMCCVPVFCFIIFMIGSALLSFTVFIFIEGTVLTFGTLILGGVLFFVGLVSVGFTLFVAGTYYSFRAMRHILTTIAEKVPPPPCMRQAESTTE